MTPHGFIADTLDEFGFNHAISQQLHRPGFTFVRRVATCQGDQCSFLCCVEFRGCPGRGRSCEAASSPSSEQRFRMLPTVDAEVLRVVQISVSCLPWSSFRRILALVMTRALCVPERVIWLSVVRSVSVSWIGYFLRLTARVFMLSD